jgi:N-acetylglutamate synthase-like GNAT family acetyltransferase
MQEQIHNYEVIFPSESDGSLLLMATMLINSYAEQGIMLSVTLEQLQIIAAQGLLAVAVSDDQEVVGTAGITMSFPDGKKEFGGWSVKEGWKASGVGKSILTALLSKASLAQSDIIAFGNKNSSPIFDKLGASVLNQTQVHEKAFVPCQTCGCHGKDQLHDGQLCVDNIFNLNALKATK